MTGLRPSRSRETRIHAAAPSRSAARSRPAAPVTADLVLAIDQGTGSTRAIAWDAKWTAVAHASRPRSTTHPRPGWAEQDPLAILASVVDTVGEVLAAVGGPDRIAAVGLDNQGETVVAWDRVTGDPLAPAVLWNCRPEPADRRPGRRRRPRSGDPGSDRPAARPVLLGVEDPLVDRARRGGRGSGTGWPARVRNGRCLADGAARRPRPDRSVNGLADAAVRAPLARLGR